MRLDRILSVSICCWLRKMIPVSPQKIPILMYHYISEQDESGISPYYRLATRPSMFDQQMGVLFKHGYKGVSLCSLFCQESLSLPSPKRVVLTFDDGYEDFYSAAWPILKKYGFSGTVFLPTGLVGQEKYMSWEQVSELAAEGVEFGSHSVSHAVLRQLPDDEILYEIYQSKHMIEEHLDHVVYSFSYPYAFPVEDSRLTKYLNECIHNAGYKLAVSTKIGMADLFMAQQFLPRLPVNDCDDDKLLMAKINGAYDWLKYFQQMNKYRNRVLPRLRGVVKLFFRTVRRR